MRARDAIKLHNGDEAIDKKTGESIKVICAFEETVNKKTTVIIEGTGALQGYNHWGSEQIK